MLHVCILKAVDVKLKLTGHLVTKLRAKFLSLSRQDVYRLISCLGLKKGNSRQEAILQ